MPWRGPQTKGEYPTLGGQVADLIETKCAIPDGDHRGEPFLLTDEMVRFLYQFYRINPNTLWDEKLNGGRGGWVKPWVYGRGGQLCRPQKWGKGPFSAAICCAEADPEGPVRFDGWDASGEPVGRPWVAPEIQITGITEDNAGNVWRALVPMIELGALRADIPDTGVTRINLAGGGLIRPVTSAALSRIGQRLRFCIQDQTESWWASNNGRALADAQRRNLAGMGGRWLSTPNAWDPADNSVAQHTATEADVYNDDVDPGPGSIRNKGDRRRMLRRVYGDSWWVDLDRVDSEIVAMLDRDPAQAERWFFNRKRAAEDAAFDADRWAALASDHVTPARALIVLGVHGRRFSDSVAIVATEVATGHQFTVGVWNAPSAADSDYEAPSGEINGALAEVMERFTVWRCYVGPDIDHLLDPWIALYGEKRMILWKTNAPNAAAHAVGNFRQAMTAGDLSNDGNEDVAAQVRNARRRKVAVYDENRRQLWVVGKSSPASLDYVNAAWAAVLSWECRGDAVAAGATAAPGEYGWAFF